MNAATADQVDRVRRHTSDATGERIDAETRHNVRTRAFDSPAELGRRIAELDREWDVERTLELNASALALTGAVLGTTVNRKWFWLTGGVLGFLFQHATSGWCPPLPVLRKLGVRTQAEIDQEKFALKTVRGDFKPDGALGPAEAALATVSDGSNGHRTAGREPDRVRRYTSAAQLEQIDSAMEQRVRQFSGQPAHVITARIGELRREWSIERYLQINAAAVGLTTAALAYTHDRRWGFATCAALAMFMFHAVEGFDPPLLVLRRKGVRTRAEIDREIYALKILRGDFDPVAGQADEADRVEAALRAVGL